jgi:hypothetical protein
MSKRQKLSFFHFEDLPDEILLKILSLLDIKGVLQCGQVSKRLRAISNDQSLWLKLNIFRRNVPFSFIEKAIHNGCEYLNLSCSCIRHGAKKSEMPWKLKYLVISQACDHKWAPNGLEGVLQNCHSLEKLSVGQMRLDSFGIEKICQNGETLRILSLVMCNIQSELIQKLFTKCSRLTEVNLYGNDTLLDRHLFAVIDNLTPNILKLDLSSQDYIEDKHVKTLVQKCNKITELALSFTQITNKSMESIVKNLSSLEKLDVCYTKIDYPTLLQLKSIPTLKVLNCFGRQKKKDAEKIKNLKLQLPHVSINEEYLFIATPSKEVDDEVDLDWFWEIRSKEQDLFPDLVDVSQF